MAKPTQSNKWATDPIKRLEEQIAARKMAEELVNETVRACYAAGYGRTAIAKASGLPSSTVYHLLNRLGLGVAKSGKPASSTRKTAKSLKTPDTSSKAGRRKAVAAHKTSRVVKGRA